MTSMTADELDRHLAALEAMPVAKLPAAELGSTLRRRIQKLELDWHRLPAAIALISHVLDVDIAVLQRRYGFGRFVEAEPARLMATLEAVRAIESRIRVRTFEAVLSHLPNGWQHRSPNAHLASVRRHARQTPVVLGFWAGHDKGWRFAHAKWPAASPHLVKFVRANAAAIDRALRA